MADLYAIQAALNADTALPAADLTARLFVRLYNDGALSRLSDNSRRRLIDYLDRQDAIQTSIKKRKSRNRELQARDAVSLAPKYPLEAANWLFADHLQRNNYSSTLSVFCIECGRPDLLNMFNVTDILTFLGLDLLSTKATDLASDYTNRASKQFMWKLLTTLNDYGNRLDGEPLTASANKLEKAMQTEEFPGVDWTPHSGVEAKLRELDIIFSKKKAVIKPMPTVLPVHATDALGALERIAALNAVANLGNEVKVLTENEAKQSMDEQLQISQRDIEHARILFEEQYQTRLDRLMQREKDYATSLEQQKNSIEEELYRQRQQIIADVSSLKLRQQEWEMEKTHVQMEFSLESKRLDKHKLECEKREQDLVQRKLRYDDYIEAQQERIAADERQKYRDDRQELDMKEEELQKLQKRLLEFEKELQLKQGKYDDSIWLSEKLRSELTAAQNEIRSLKMQCENTASLRTLLENAEARAKLSDARHDELLQKMMGRMEAEDRTERADLVALRQLVKDLGAEKTQLTETFALQQRRLQNQLHVCNEKLRKKDDENDMLEIRMEELQRLTRVNNLTVANERSLPANKSFFEPIDVKGVDLHETYFDTSLSLSRLPPELELEIGDFQSQSKPYSAHTNHALTGSTRDRIRALEIEAEALERQYQALKDIKSPMSKHDDRIQKMSTPHLTKGDETLKSSFILPSASPTKIPQFNDEDPRLTNLNYTTLNQTSHDKSIDGVEHQVHKTECHSRHLVFFPELSPENSKVMKSSVNSFEDVPGRLKLNYDNDSLKNGQDICDVSLTHSHKELDKSLNKEGNVPSMAKSVSAEEDHINDVTQRKSLTEYSEQSSASLEKSVGTVSVLHSNKINSSNDKLANKHVTVQVKDFVVSAINLDSAWKRPEDSSEASYSSESLSQKSNKDGLLQPLHSTPQSTLLTSALKAPEMKPSNDDKLVSVYVEPVETHGFDPNMDSAAAIEMRDDDQSVNKTISNVNEEAEVNVSGGLSDVEISKSDFEW